MPNPSAPGQGKKAFYLFLCSILGMILFITIHQFLWAIYQDLTVLGYLRQVPVTLFAMVFSLMVAMLLGLWYGIWLGLYWYSFVYESGRSPWFHAFRGGHSRSSGPDRPAQSYREQAFSSQASAERWQLEDLLDDEPSGIGDYKSGSGGRNVTVRSVEVSTPDMEVPTMESKRRTRKPGTAAKSSRTRRTGGNGSIGNNSEEL
jgi:hypothetical protein